MNRGDGVHFEFDLSRYINVEQTIGGFKFMSV